jgi:hypothetical protein
MQPNLKIQNILFQLVQPRRKGTLVYIYYNDFERRKKYCVGVKATKSFEVMDIKPAGVKVYDYNDKSKCSASQPFTFAQPFTLF